VSVIDSYVCLANDFFCVSLCLGLVFIVCMYYVTVIALSHHVSVVTWFVHIIIIIIHIIAASCHTGRIWLMTRVESSRDIRSRRRTRCTVTTAPDDDGTRHPQLQPALSSAGTGGS